MLKVKQVTRLVSAASALLLACFTLGSSQRSYDSLQRLTGVTLKNAGGIQLRTQSYTYDDDSNVATHNLAGTTTTYGYDEESQLVAEDRSGYSADYTYDGNGNRLTRVIAGGVSETYDYDDGDKLESVTWTGHTKTYGYDDAGRTTWEKLDGSYTRQYTYDYDSRVTQIVYGGTTENYAFNGFGTRVSKTVSGTTKDFLRAGVGVTAAVLSDGNAHYTPGVSESRSSTTRFFHAGLSNTDAQSTTGSSVTATRRYDAFGNTDASSGTWNSPFGYAGGFGYQDDGSGLKLLGHRLYDPSVGRFVSRDQTMEGRNWYGYCHNNPITLVDFYGLAPDWLNSAREFVTDYGKAVVGVISGVLLIKSIAAAVEITYEAGLRADERRKFDKILDGANDMGYFEKDPEHWVRLKKYNNDTALEDGKSMWARWWQVVWAIR